MELIDLQGIGKARLAALHAAGIDSLRDLLYTVPFRYRDMGTRTTVAEARVGERQTLVVERYGEPKIFRRGKLCRVTCTFRDDTGEVLGCWFNQPWMMANLMRRQRFLMFGRVEMQGHGLRLTNPSIEDEIRIVPVYRPLEGLPARTRENLVRQALEQVDDACPETLPDTLLKQYNLMGVSEAIRALHTPETLQSAAMAQRRFAFEQLLYYQVAVREMKGLKREGRALCIPSGTEDTFWKGMPFSPTNAQRRTLREIAADQRKPLAMARMVQGDVGCGKTAIAFGAIWLCVKAGYQAALMAPTEILARQHYETAKRLLEPMGVHCGLLLGGMGVKERRNAARAIAAGEWQAVIGTHVLLGEGLTYATLGLCVTDEQHRFGVGQRTRLLRKGGNIPPDLLVMSATPIPRSLALTMFGDLDVSVVDELPPGRTPVQTRIVPEEKHKDMYLFLRKEIEKGRQAYVVCPLVEEDEADEQRKAVESHFESLCRGAA